MVRTTKNLITPTVTTALVAPADMLKRTVQLGKAASAAALEFCYSAAAYILLVSHFKTAKEEGYMSKTKAVEYLEEQLTKQLGVGSRMIYNYLSPASDIVTALTGSLKMFGPTVQELGLAKTPEAMVEILSSWMDTNKDKKHESLNDVRESFGYYTPTAAKAKPMNAERAVAVVERAMTAVVDKAVDKGRVAESELGAAIVKKVHEKGSFVEGMIEAIFDAKTLKRIIEVCQKQIKVAERLSTAAKANAKDGGTKATTVKQASRSKPRGRGRSQQVSA